MPGEQLLEVGQVVLGLALGEGAPEHADHRRALEQGQVHRQLGDAAAGEADHQQAAVPGDGADGFVEQVAPHRVVDHVGALAAGQFLDLLLQAAGAVVDQQVGAGGLGHFQLLVTAGGGDDPRAHGLADLHRRQADAAGGAEHQQGFPRLQVGALLERVHGGAVGHAEGSGGIEVDALGDRHHVVAGHGHLLGEATPAGQRHDPVAGLEVTDLLADGSDGAGGFATRGEGERRLELVLAFDDQGVREVDPGGVHVDQHFVLLRLGAGNLFEHQGLGGAEGLAQDGFHGGFDPRWRPARRRPCGQAV